MPPKSQPDVVIRPAKPEDSSVCGQICYDAFLKINQAHGFPCDFPGPERTTGLLSTMFTSPGFYCVVAEAAGRLVGSNCLDERSMIAAVGPITVDPSAQHAGIGRKLMRAVMDRANGRHAAGMRLVQAAFHNRSLSLYTSLGFDVREPLSCVQGKTRERNIPGCTVRPAQATDLDACNGLSRRVHGFDRGTELAQAIENKTAVVVERAGRITGYASALAFFGHATAETNTDMQSLLASVESFAGPGILVPSRNGALLRWCLANGLRIIQPLTLMSIGLYNPPAGAWLPSVLY
jgi:L-amino acid N-acyltransferase YncA